MPRKTEPRCCRTCALCDAARDKIGVVGNDRGVKCLWTSTEDWPSSADPQINRRPYLFTMRADAGTDCPCWRERQS